MLVGTEAVRSSHATFPVKPLKLLTQTGSEDGFPILQEAQQKAICFQCPKFASNILDCANGGISSPDENWSITHSRARRSIILSSDINAEFRSTQRLLDAYC